MLIATVIVASLAVLGLAGAGNAHADATICFRTRVPTETSHLADCETSCNAPDVSVTVTTTPDQNPPAVWTCVRT